MLAFAALCYLPLLATSPGQVVADTKTYLYLNPDRLLSRAWSMWDPHVGMGTVTHQNIGFLWPMGPYFWLMQHLGVPDWTAQRLWLGSIIFLAGLGMRYLLRVLDWRGRGVAVAMCAYALTPYLLTIAPRISAILLPFAALPWMIGLTVRAVRTGSWRHPAAFALVVTTAGTSNATSILLAGLGPALWVLWAAAARDQTSRRIVAAIARMAALTIGANLWWIGGLSVQATNGIDVLRYTESVQTTAAASSAQEVLRGLGYWFFYGDDAFGPWIGPSRPFQTSIPLLVATFTVPVLALAGGALSRFRERSFTVLLAIVGLVLAVGAYPYSHPSPFGRVLRAFLNSDTGMAMRSMPRAAPLVVLALAVMLGAGVHALGERLPRAAGPAAAGVIALVIASLPPLWQRTFVPANLRRPEAIPSYWRDAARHLGATDDGTRVLEVPGADFTSYRWGTTIDPVTPGLTDRPMVARELVPMGSPAAWNLLKAFDGRLQANLAEPTSVAPVARAMRAGQILVRSDLAYEHYDTPRPRALWAFLVSAPGLGAPTEFGAPTANIARAPEPLLDELELGTPPLRDAFPVTVLPVRGAVPIVTTKATSTPVVLAGDGDGLVDSATAGVIDGTELVRYSASMSDAELRRALDDGAVLVVTDSNRRRGERWGTIRFTNGYTEPAGLTPLVVDRSDARLPVFPDASDDTRTVALHRGGITANATSYGGRNEYLPEDRPANAVDGDPATSWRTSRDDPTTGERLDLRTERPVTPRSLTFVAPPPPINRWVTRIALRFDGGPPLVIDLDQRSRKEPGQRVDIGNRTFSRLSIEILADSAGSRPRYGGLTSTGFAEVRIGDLRLDEVIRPPVDLLGRAGPASTSHALAVVLTRLRAAPTDVERLDEEPTIKRVVQLPTTRSFSLSGTARLSARATDPIVNDLLDRGPGPTVTASSRLPVLTARASAAVDGDPATAWTAAYGDPVGQWIELDDPEPHAIDRLDLRVVADGRHSVPTRLAIEVDGRRVATLPVPAIADGPTPNDTTQVSLPLPTPIVGSRIRIVVEAARTIDTTEWRTRRPRTLPVALAEVDVAGLRRAAPSGRFSTGCRSDLLSVDGRSVPVEVSGSMRDAVTGAPLALTTCGDATQVTLPSGSSELRSAPGIATGVDIDRVVLRSAAGGAADLHPDATIQHLVDPTASESTGSPSATVTRSGPDVVKVRINSATEGRAFWLSFGQGWNRGWSATADGQALGAPQLVDGFANGWQITPQRTEVEVTLRFTPQGRVNLALWASLLVALTCLAVATGGSLLARRRTQRDLDSSRPTPTQPWTGPTLLTSAGAVGSEPTPLPRLPALALAGVLGGVGVAVATPAVGALTGVLALIVSLGAVPRRVTALVAPVAMATSAAYVIEVVARHHIAPGLDWADELRRAHPIALFAVLALTVDAVVMTVRRARRR